MSASTSSRTTSSQWLFPLAALESTPSLTTSNYPLERELYDRARGVEFLFRLGSSLALPSSATFTAATWFHRFYMRHSMEDYHRQDVAASCIFLATKTEECGRKLRDVARVCYSKGTGVDISLIQAESKEVEQCQNAILLTEEVLLEALCFDFVIDSPHSELVELFEALKEENLLQDYAWSVAHDSYRTPLCLLYPPRIVATACHILAQRVFDGNHSPSLDSRTSFPAPAASLPTPPTHQPLPPDTSRLAAEYFSLDQTELASVTDALSILVEFYRCQSAHGALPYLSRLAEISPPTTASARPQLYPLPTSIHQDSSSTVNLHGRTPNSLHGGSTPMKPSSSGLVSSRGDGQKSAERLDLS